MIHLLLLLVIWTCAISVIRRTNLNYQAFFVPDVFLLLSLQHSAMALIWLSGRGGTSLTKVRAPQKCSEINRFWGGKGGVKSLRQRQGGTFLRDHSIPRKRKAEMEGGRTRERKTRFSPTLTKMLFDVSDTVIHNNKLKHCFISIPLAFPFSLVPKAAAFKGQQLVNLCAVYIESLCNEIRII